MTRVIVNDASCLIDLRKGRLLEVLCNLPHQLVVPLPVRASEILDFSYVEWEHLDNNGVVTYDLTPEEVANAIAERGKHPGLSANDCFCLVTAITHSGILLTGDALLRKVATQKGVCVHGVLWMIDELAHARACPSSLLIEALRAWRCDRTVFLPSHEIAKRLAILEGNC